eukprot:363936-Chlamydomonas_euryale.AAC.8
MPAQPANRSRAANAWSLECRRHCQVVRNGLQNIHWDMRRRGCSCIGLLQPGLEYEREQLALQQCQFEHQTTTT